LLCDQNFCFVTFPQMPEFTGELGISQMSILANSILLQDDDPDVQELWSAKSSEARKKELSSLFSRINIPSLRDRAMSLRPGFSCEVGSLSPGGTIVPLDPEHVQPSDMGGMNYHIHIKWSDNTYWIARIRRLNASTLPEAWRNQILRSEAATLSFLQKTTVPSPRLFACPSN
jgi:hypothetical protein